MKLFILYILMCIMIGLRINADATNYLTPDAIAYLETAQYLTNNFFSLLSHDSGEEEWNYRSTWPIGYPLCISWVAVIAHTNMFCASKLLNAIVLGGIFLLLQGIYKQKAYFPALVFCAFTFLEVFSHSWSESVFLFMLLWFCFSLNKYLQEREATSHHHLLSIFFSALFMFLCRYAGAFSFILIGCLGALLQFRGVPVKGKRLISTSFLLLTVGCTYFFINFSLTHSIAGGDRINPMDIGNAVFFTHMVEGLFNELLIIRNHYFTRHYQDLLFVLTTLFQLCMLILIYFKTKRYWKWQSEGDYFTGVLLGVGGFYFVVLSVLIRLGACNLFDYRVLAPFTMLLYLAIMHIIITEKTGVLYQKLKPYVLLLFISSLLFNLPKKYLLSLLIP